MYKTKCGYVDEDENPKFAEITCMLVGCKDCNFKTDTIYYEQNAENMRKGFSEWLKTK